MITENFLLPREALKNVVNTIVATNGFTILSSDNISGLLKVKVSGTKKLRFNEVHFLITSGNFRQTKVKITCVKKVFGIAIPFSSFAAEENNLMEELKTQIHKI